jgi:hypothetical protein
MRRGPDERIDEFRRTADLSLKRQQGDGVEQYQHMTGHSDPPREQMGK